MAKTSTKRQRETKPHVALIAPTTIPLDKLTPSNANVRRVKPAIAIEALADSIARRGLLQSLSVRPALDADGNDTGTCEVQAGGRRLRALKLLVKQKRLAKDAPVPCIVKTAGIAEDDSLAENADREALHPLDEYRAFAALRAKGWSDDDIAAARGVTPAVVRQRLRLASAAPALLDAYAEDKLSLEQLMAFCITTDHTRQQQVLEAIERGQVIPSAYNIRRLLTETCVHADDPRARFVGVAAYEAAGGIVLRDIFEQESGGWLQDPELLMRLVSEKLAGARDRILAQGWKWAEAALDMPYSVKQDLLRLHPIAPALSEEEDERLAALADEHDELIEGLPDDAIPEDVRTRLDAIDAEMAELDNRPPKFAPEDIARGGVLISVNHDGQLNVEYGFLRSEDAPDQDEEDGADSSDATDGASHLEVPASGETGDPGEDDGIRPLPDRLAQDLTSFRTLGLRNAMAEDFDLAFLAVLHAMCLDLFFHTYDSHGCLQIRAVKHFRADAPGLAATPAAKAIEERHQRWAARLPEDPRRLWDTLVDLSRQGSLVALFAHCASLTVNAVREPHQQRRQALRHADSLAAALSLDMNSAGWATTAESFLGRVTKARILEAVREAKGESAVRLIEHLKKSDMAKEAERLLEGTGWLPEPLRTPELNAASPAAAGASEPSPLPEFLTEGIGEETDSGRLAAE